MNLIRAVCVTSHEALSSYVKDEKACLVHLSRWVYMVAHRVFSSVTSTYPDKYRRAVSNIVLDFFFPPSGIYSNPSIADMVAGYLHREDVFGIDAWEKYFGAKVVGPEPPLPQNLDEILQSPSPCSNRTIADDFMLVLVPKEYIVGGKQMFHTPNNFEKLVKERFPKGKYDYFWPPACDKHGKVHPKESYWVLMSKDILSGSRNKSYADQQKQVKDLSKNSGISYEVPTLLEAITCIFAEYARTKTHLYKREPLTYTRCQENMYGCQLIIGSFASSGLYVYHDCGSREAFLGVSVTMCINPTRAVTKTAT
jgi:hypothetical protein